MDKKLLMRALESVFFHQARQQAQQIGQSPGKILGLLQQVLQKASAIATPANANIGTLLVERITTLARLLKAYASGRYRAIPWATIIRILAVLIYFLSPIDIIPDLLPVIGLSDDLALVLWLFESINSDLRAFTEWENRS
jgi:uncharacterized membrane protein YkvA (DUF1232 family)